MNGSDPRMIALAFASDDDAVSVLFSEQIGVATAETTSNYELFEGAESRGNPTRRGSS